MINNEGNFDSYESYNYDQAHAKTHTNQDLFYEGSSWATEQSSDVIRSQLKQGIPRFLNCSVSISKISCGKFHWALLGDNSKIYTMGNNSYGQLGIGREFKSALEDNSQRINNNPMEVYSESSFITHPKFVFGIINPVVNVECGWYHTLAMTNSNDIFAWGKGDKGQLGMGRVKRAQILPIKIDHFSDRRNKIVINEISGGKNHSMFVSIEGRIFVWGSHYLTSMPNYMSKNVAIECLGQIEKNSIEIVPIEIGIPDWIDNHEKVKTSFIIRSASADNITNMYQPSSLFTPISSSTKVTEINLKNEIKRKISNQINDGQVIKTNKSKRNSKAKGFNLGSEVVMDKGIKLQVGKMFEKQMTDDKRKPKSKQTKRYKSSRKAESAVKSNINMSQEGRNKENINEFNQNSLSANTNAPNCFTTFNKNIDTITRNQFREQNKPTASFNSSKKLENNLIYKTDRYSNININSFINQGKNDSMGSESSGHPNMIDTKTLVKLIANMEKQTKKNKKSNFLKDYQRSK